MRTPPKPKVQLPKADCKVVDDTSSSQEVGSRTTVMLRNVPNNYSRSMLLELLDEEGFAGLYDFLYVPFDFKKNAGLGYAFVNLVDADAVSKFWHVFDGFSNWAIPTAKVCAVSWSEPLQGLAANVERYRNSPVMHPKVPEQYRPVLFQNGARIEFPKPTKAIKPPLSRS